MTALESFKMARRAGVSASCLHPLLMLLDDSPRTPFQIAQDMGCTASNVTGLIDRLEAGGWVQRLRHESDRRMWNVIPTQRAFEVFSPMMREEAAAI